MLSSEYFLKANKVGAMSCCCQVADSMPIKRDCLRN